MSRQRLSLTTLLLLLAGPVLAQRFTAAIRGNVTDPSHAVIAGAKVELKNEQTGLARTGTANEAGNCVFADLPVGSYQLEVTFAGFKSAVRTFLGYSMNTGYNVESAVFDTGNPATATKIVSATPPGNFGQLTAARDPRTVRLGIRVVF